MKSKLGVRIALGFLLVAIFSIVFVASVINFALDYQFNRYLDQQEARQAEVILESLEAAFATNVGGMGAFVTQLAQVAERVIVVKDLKGRVLVEGSPPRRMLGRYSLDEVYSTELPLRVEGNVVGSVLIFNTHRQRGVYSDSDLVFRRTINQGILVAGLLGAIFALINSLWLSKALTAPLKELTNAVRKMGQGDTTQRSTLKGKDELALLGQAFNEMAEKLAKIEELRRKLVGDVSHELRTPLTTLLGYVQGVVDGVLEPNLETFSVLEEEILRLSQLVTDLQELAQAEAPVKEKVRVSLGDIARKVAKRGQALPTSKEVSLMVSVFQESFVWGCPLRLERAVYNLVMNAVTYSKPRGRVELIVECEDDLGILRVRDEGEGIPEEQLPFIFERFFRVDPSRTRETGGSGIGLALVEETVKAHNGRVEVRSALQEGSTFTILLPLAKELPPLV